MELGLEWLESQRAVMYDERFQDFFLRYTDGQGNKIGKIYNEPINFGDQYFCESWAGTCAQYAHSPARVRARTRPRRRRPPLTRLALPRAALLIPQGTSRTPARLSTSSPRLSTC
jgi:hypothetical protein